MENSWNFGASPENTCWNICLHFHSHVAWLISHCLCLKLVDLNCSLNLRQNPTGNWEISIFSGQKPCTTIYSILHSFLHFLRAIDVITPKKITYGSPRKRMSNFTKLHLLREIFRILSVFSQLLWKLTFIISDSHDKFSLVLLQITNYIFSPWKM